MTVPFKPKPVTPAVAVKGKPTGGVPYTGPELNGMAVQPAPADPGPGGAGGPDFSRVLPSVGGANVAAIQPGQNDLRGTQITPGASPRLTGMAAQTDASRSAYAAAPAFSQFQPVNASGSPYTATADTLGGRAVAGIPTNGFQPVAAGTMGGQAGGLLQRAIGAAGEIGGASFGGDTAAARAGTMRALEALESAPNRGDLAARQFELLREAGNTGFEQDLRRVGQRASALGRVGAGMTTSDLGDVAQRREEALSRDARGLALDAASREMEDRLARVSANQGVAGTFGGLDLSASGLNADAARSRASLLSGLSDQTFGQERSLRDETRGEQDRGLDYGIRGGDFLGRLSDQAFARGSSLRNEDREERDTQRRFEEGDFSRVRTQLGDLAGLEDNQRGWEASDRNELRGERGYQDDLAQTGIDRAVQQRGFEEDLYNSGFDRDQSEMSRLYGMGFGTDPTGVLQGQASGYADQAAQDWAGAGDALGEYMASRVPSGMSRGTADQVIGSSTPRVIPQQLTPRPIRPVQPWQTPVQGG